MAGDEPRRTTHRRQSACRSLAELQLAPLAEVGREAVRARGTTLFRQGERRRSFSVLLHGRARMSCVMPSGQSLTLALYSGGDVIGFAGAMSGRCRRASVVATERCICHEVESARLFRLFRRRPETVGQLLPLLSRNLVDCKRCFLELVTGRVASRMARLFVELAGELGESKPQGVAIPLHLSRQELADLAGTSLETSIRVMSRWSKGGLVETRGDGFLVRDLAALQRFAEA